MIQADYHHLYPFQVVYDWLTTTEYAIGNQGSRKYAFQFNSNAMTRFKVFFSADEVWKMVKKENQEQTHPCKLSMSCFKKSDQY